MTTNRTTLIFIVLPLFLSLIFQISWARPSYPEAQAILKKAPENIQTLMKGAPNIYEFPSQFDKKGSVSFTESTFTQVLISDLKSFMQSLKRGSYPGSAIDATTALNSYFKFKFDGAIESYGSINGKSRHRLRFKDVNGKRKAVSEGKTYNDIHIPGENLVDKIAGYLKNKELKGWNTNNFYGLNLLDIDADGQKDFFVGPEDLIQAIFQTVADRASKGSSFTVPNGSLENQRIHSANVTKDGIDLNQIVNKLLHGSIIFSRASSYYLSTDLGPDQGLQGDNTKPYENSKNYTTLEHFWDKAFGYFGAARDFATYTDTEIAKKFSKDSDGDNKISVLREKNIGAAAINSARIDQIAAIYGDGGLDLSGEAIRAFIIGRELISKKPPRYLEYVEAQAAIAIGTWEKTLAAVVIHYINSTLKIMQSYGTEEYLFTNHAKFWSEMKGYALAFQFNPTSQLSMDKFMDKFEEFHLLVGDKPTLMTASPEVIDSYKKNLLRARNILKEAFGFSQVNTDIF